MLVAQEYYYITSGTYKHRKSITVIYEIVPSGYTREIAALYPDEKFPPPPNGLARIPTLPSIKVSGTQFKEFERLRKTL